MKSFLPSFILLYVLAAPAEVNVTGSWDMVVDAPQGKATPSLILKQDGEKVTGTYRGQMGQSEVQGSVKTNRIRFSLTLKLQDTEVLVVYSGTVEPNSMHGTVQFGDLGSGNWSATRH